MTKYKADCIKCGNIVSFENLINTIGHDKLGTCEHCGCQQIISEYNGNPTSAVVPKKKLIPAITSEKPIITAVNFHAMAKFIAISACVAGLLYLVYIACGYVYNVMAYTDTKEVKRVYVVESSRNGVVVLNNKETIILKNGNNYICERKKNDYFVITARIRYNIKDRKILSVRRVYDEHDGSCYENEDVSPIDFSAYQKFITP